VPVETADQFAPGLLRRIALILTSWFKPPDVPEPARPGPLIERRRASQPLTVPAQGGAFDFLVFPSYTWRSEGLIEDALHSWIDYYGARVRNGVRECAVDLAREHPPHHVSEFQAQLNERLAVGDWRFERDSAQLVCQVHGRVAPDERVRDRLQPYWEKVIEMETAHQLAIRRAELVRELAELWSNVLKELRGNPLTVHAARLTEGEFAEVFERLVSERQETTRELIRVLESAINGHRAVGLSQYEFIEGFDHLLKMLKKQEGL